jgi:hypothetical protein
MRSRWVLVLGMAVLAYSGMVSAAAAGTIVHVGDRWNGKAVTLHVGDVLSATLGSTYWMFGPTPSNLAADGPMTTHVGGSSCPRFPGSGCGWVQRQYQATRAGSAVLSASRTSCGEALRCTGGAGRWRLTVRVVGAVTGRVTSSPSCPVERADHPCPPTPVRANVQAVRDGTVAATAGTDANGTYQLSLRPATYELRVQGQGRPRCPTKTVTVTSGRQVVDFDCDSGIR